MFQGNLLSILKPESIVGPFLGIGFPYQSPLPFVVFPTQPVGKVANLLRRVTCHTTQGPPEEVARCQGGIRGHGVAAPCWTGGSARARTGQARRGGVGGDATEVEVGAWRLDAGKVVFFFFFGGGGNIQHIIYNDYVFVFVKQMLWG